MSKKTLPQTIEHHKRRLFRLKNHPFIVPVVTLILLIFITQIGLVVLGGTTIGPADSRVVHVFVDDQERTLPTRAATVEDLLKRLDISIKKGDIVEPKLKTEILEDGFTVNIYRARPVTVVDGKKRITKLSAQQSPEGIAREAGVKLYPEDNVRLTVPEDVINEGVVGQKFVIERSVPMKLVLYGKSYEIRTHAHNVEALLREKNINKDEVTVFPAKDSKIKAGSVIFVTLEGKQIKSVEKIIKNKTETINDPSLILGATKIREKGRKGKKVVLYEIDKKTGKKKVLQEVIAYAAVNRVVVKGTKVAVTGSKADWMRAAGIPSSQYQYVDYIISRESGWEPSRVSANRCIGLGQRCNPSILISACPNWQNDPVCQLKHFTGYANGRYGSWQGAYNAWQFQGWW